MIATGRPRHHHGQAVTATGGPSSARAIPSAGTRHRPAHFGHLDRGSTARAMGVAVLRF